jgi:molecular chaperone DnaK
MSLSVGIDLGTSNSCLSYVKDGRAQLLSTEKAIPSIVAVNEMGKIKVGLPAKKIAHQNPSFAASSTKRLLGRNFLDENSRQNQLFTYEIDNNLNDQLTLKIRDKVMSLEKISSAIIEHLIQTATIELNTSITDAVITVPAYFNNKQRQLVRKAGRKAGVNVLRIINEPTAAALAYGVQTACSTRLLIYDFGGGTFDISVVDIKKNVFTVKVCGGDCFLGGIDFDDRILQFLLEYIRHKCNLDLSMDKSILHRLRLISERAKIQLSNKEQHRIFIPHLAEVNNKRFNLDLILTRKQLEALTEDLVDRSLNTMEQLLDENNIILSSIGEVLVVGGQAKMPLIQRKLHSMLGKRFSTRVPLEEAIAKGAALMAYSLHRRKTLTLKDTLPLAIGIKRKDGSMQTLFAKGSPLPAKITKRIVCRRQSVSIHFMQGTKGKISQISRCSLHTLSTQKQTTVIALFQLNEQGQLSVQAYEHKSKRPVRVEVHYP